MFEISVVQSVLFAECQFRHHVSVLSSDNVNVKPVY